MLTYFFHAAKIEVANAVLAQWERHGPRCPFWFYVPCAPDRVIKTLLAAQEMLRGAKVNAGVVAYRVVASRGVLIKLLHLRVPVGMRGSEPPRVA